VKGRAVIEYLIERMVLSGLDKIFINTAEDKTDLIHYLASKSIYRDHLIFLVRPRKGLLDGIILPEQFLRENDELYFGLPDTIWYPKDAYLQVAGLAGELVLGLFDTGTPERFDSVVLDQNNQIQSIEVKVAQPKTKWTWAIGKLTVRIARILESNPFFGISLHNYCQSNPGFAVQIQGSSCLDIGIPEDYAKAAVFVKNHEQ